MTFRLPNKYSSDKSGSNFALPDSDDRRSTKLVEWLAIFIKPKINALSAEEKELNDYINQKLHRMNLEELREYCLSKKGVVEDMPFDDSILVFKVMGKMFAACNLTWENPGVNLKCDPERAIELRDQYDGIRPGYHMNKVHWNTVSLVEDVPISLVRELIDHSYEIVVLKLTKKDKAILNDL